MLVMEGGHVCGNKGCGRICWSPLPVENMAVPHKLKHNRLIFRRKLEDGIESPSTVGRSIARRVTDDSYEFIALTQIR